MARPVSSTRAPSFVTSPSPELQTIVAGPAACERTSIRLARSSVATRAITRRTAVMSSSSSCAVRSSAIDTMERGCRGCARNGFTERLPETRCRISRCSNAGAIAATRCNRIRCDRALCSWPPRRNASIQTSRAHASRSGTFVTLAAATAAENASPARVRSPAVARTARSAAWAIS